MPKNTERPKSKWRTTLRWTGRIVLVVLLLVVVGGVGFEVWRQHDIKEADKAFAASVERLDEVLDPDVSYDEYRDYLVTGNDGTEAFIDFMLACNAYGTTLPDNPVERLDLPGREPLEGAEPPTEAELRQWLEETQPIMDALSDVSAYDSIVLREDDERLHWYESRISSIWLFGIQHLDVPLERAMVLHRLGEHDRALTTARVVREVELALRDGASFKQLFFASFFTALTRDLNSYFARNDLYEPADLRAAAQFEADWHLHVASAMRGFLITVRDNPGAVFRAFTDDPKYHSGWFTWLDLANWDKFDGGEFLENTIGYAYQLRQLADFVDHTRENLLRIDEGERPDMIAEDTRGIQRLWRWDMYLEGIAGVVPKIQLQAAIIRIRLLQHEGHSPDEIRAAIDAPEYVTIDWTGEGCTLAYRYDVSVYGKLSGEDPVYMPEREEFFAEYPPVTLVVKR